MSRIWHRVLGLGLGLGLLAAQPAQAQSVEQFYKGRAVTMLVGTAPGGINDISARLLANYLGLFIPGNPTMVVQINPGAGALITANKLYNSAEKDGSVLAKFERAVPQLQIQGDPILSNGWVVDKDWGGLAQDYVRTGQGSQGMTADRAIVVYGTPSLVATREEGFYVPVSRVKNR